MKPYESWFEKMRGLGVCAMALSLSLSWAHARTPAATAEKVVARQGDSISYLAIRYYGYFNDSLFTALQKVNPHIADWPRLVAGDSLFFPTRTAALPAPEALRTQAASAVLTFLEGDVRYRRGATAFAPAAVNLQLQPNDELVTGENGRAELVLDNRSVMRLTANSHLKITALQRPATGANSAAPYQASFSLSVGSIWTRVTLFLDKPPKIEVKLPTAIAGVQGTIYRATVAADSTTQLRVYEGTVSVRANPLGNAPQRIGPPQQISGPQQITVEAWIKKVRAYQELIIAKNGKPSEPRPFNDQGEDLAWVRWNQERDRDLSAER